MKYIILSILCLSLASCGIENTTNTKVSPQNTSSTTVQPSGTNLSWSANTDNNF